MNTGKLPKLIYPGPGAGYSYHNHSILSDGESTPEEMCRAAKKAGLKEFGLSDHYVIHPDPSLMPVDWSIDITAVDAYIARLLALKNELDDDGFTIRMGLEVDFFFENADEVLKELEKYPLDYLIGSVHYAGTFPVDHSSAPWEVISDEEKHTICMEYWQKMKGAAQCGRFRFLGHLDLPKKFALLKDPSIYYTQAREVLDICAETGTGIELNTSGWYKPCAEQYPSFDILREAARRRVPVVINPDAHHQDHVDRGFAQAAQVVSESQAL